MWEAAYSDGGILKQDDDQGEHKFSEINLGKLTTFRVYSVSNASHEILLDLVSGKFYVKDVCLDFGYPNVNKRLIYFRRVKQTLGGDSKCNKVVEHLGWQATIDGKNVKRVICFKNGEMCITCD